MTYPHRYDREIVTTGAGWPYRCRCGLGSPIGGEREDNCPAAMREHIAELSGHAASVHKAAHAAMLAERVAVVAWLRRPCTDDAHDDRWCPACGPRLDDADYIEHGEHREAE